LIAPLALMRHVVDTITDWATQHLDADVWSRRSDADRAARLRNATDVQRAGGYRYHDL
jgi:hypothetical protein